MSNIHLCHWSPYYSVTQGHRSIVRYVMDNLQRTMNGGLDRAMHTPVAVTVSTSENIDGHAEHWLPISRVLLVDWPWAYYIETLNEKVLSQCDLVIGLSMTATEREYDREDAQIAAGRVQRVICVEPTRHSGREYALDCAPVINADAVRSLEERDILTWEAHANRKSRNCLVLQTGKDEEKDYLLEAARRNFPSSRLLPSAHLPISWPGRLARLAEDVVLAPGYSTFWEMAHMQLAHRDKLNWYTFDRPVEDFAARLGLTAHPQKLTDRFSLPTMAERVVDCITDIIVPITERDPSCQP